MSTHAKNAVGSLMILGEAYKEQGAEGGTGCLPQVEISIHGNGNNLHQRFLLPLDTLLFWMEILADGACHQLSVV